MSTFWYVGLEPLNARYTAQLCREWFPDAFRRCPASAGWNYVDVPVPEVSREITVGRVLDAQGRGLVDAALEAARLRLRPIVMTSLAFILGVLPLMLATGAGAGAQNALGTAVVGGMVSGTVLAVVFVPLFFVVVSRVMGRRPSPVAPAVLEAH